MGDNPQLVRCSQPRKPKKPRLTIELTGSKQYPVIFTVKWPGKPWKTRQTHTWDEALIALGLKSR